VHLNFVSSIHNGRYRFRDARTTFIKLLEIQRWLPLFERSTTGLIENAFTVLLSNKRTALALARNLHGAS
jgi:hypothetical protein